MKKKKKKKKQKEENSINIYEKMMEVLRDFTAIHE